MRARRIHRSPNTSLFTSQIALTSSTFSLWTKTAHQIPLSGYTRVSTREELKGVNLRHTEFTAAGACVLLLDK
ncbi:hypothetical protein QQF64_030170 [Cirrhinus molitorella]|uniref:Uncharacterized protein n=1 Tax=Cirrhinus molitorella TaxID=172907 RepID=A0ABR3N2M3_9TELE